MNMISVVLYLLAILLAGAAVYIWTMLLASRFYPGSGFILPVIPRTRFKVVVPAHDEADHITDTLASLHALDYSRELYEVIVVADNCSDDTAVVSRTCGVRCIERNDPDRPGKGYALEYAFNVVLDEDVDAIVVVDADTKVERNLLQALDIRHRAGQRAVQSHYRISDPEAGPLPALLAAGNSLENEISRGKAALGLPTMLRGNGMCLDADLLRELPWRAYSVTEDTEYSIEVLKRGVPISYAPETGVAADAPQTLDQLRSQRIRWASGNSAMGIRHALGLLARGFRERNAALADTGWFMLIRSKPLLIAGSLLCAASVPAGKLPLLVGIAPMVMVGLSILPAVMFSELSVPRLKTLALAPGYLLWLIGIALFGLINHRSKSWTRTERAS